MTNIKPRKKYVISKGVRAVIIITVVILILITIVVSLIRAFTGFMDPQFFIILIPPFLIGLAVLITVIYITVLATHRVIGPFERLNKEMDLIKAPEYHRRLNVREKDDQQVASFISKINTILEKVEQLHSSEINLLTELDNELSEITALDTDRENPKEIDNNAVMALHRKIKSKLNKAKAASEENI